MKYLLVVVLCLSLFAVHVQSGDVVEDILDDLLCFGKWDYIVVGGGAGGSVVAAR
jgi:hypothetical protein